MFYSSNKCSIILDSRADTETKENLKAMGLNVMENPVFDCLYDAVASHTDMVVHYIKENNRLIVAPEAYDYYKSIMGDFDVIKGSAHLSSKYPHDICYNVAAFGKYVICKTSCTAIEILQEYQSIKKEILNVNQGYSKCSICIVNDRAVITADESIAKVLENHDADVLKIQPGFIELRNLPYGFIGGASGLLQKDLLLINGELKTHPDADKIKSFCLNHSVYIEEIKKGSIVDIGSILAL